jgi:Condensation domain
VTRTIEITDVAERISKLSSAKLELLGRRLLKNATGERLIQRRKQPDTPAVLSFSQQRMWLLHQLEPNSSALNTSAAVRLRGPLDTGALFRSLTEIVRRHESLRTTFELRDKEPVQVVHEMPEWKLPLIDLSQLPEARREEELTVVTVREAERPFVLSEGPVLRTTLVKLAEEHYVLQIVMHHIASDGWSMGVLVREVAELYRANARKEASPLPELPLQYSDYAEWQREWLRGDAAAKQLNYWKRQLAGAPPSLDLPVDRERPAVLSYRGETLTFELGEQLSSDLKTLGLKEGATLFMVMLAAFKTLLHLYTAQTEIVVGTNIANRNRGQLENLIGCFVNNLALRTDLSGNPTFREVLARVREVTLAAYANQELPYEVIVDTLRGEEGRAEQLFQVMLVLQNNPLPAVELEGLEVSFIPLGTEAAAFDLILYLMETRRGLVGLLQYDRDLFEASTIKLMIERLTTLLREIVADPDEYITNLSMTTAEEMKALTASFNVAL